MISATLWAGASSNVLICRLTYGFFDCSHGAFLSGSIITLSHPLQHYHAPTTRAPKAKALFKRFWLLAPVHAISALVTAILRFAQPPLAESCTIATRGDVCAMKRAGDIRRSRHERQVSMAIFPDLFACRAMY